MKTSALVVFSGGQDSTTCLYLAKRDYAEVHALSFDYGQRHSIEIEAARKIAKMAEVTSHEILQIGSNVLRSVSPLTSERPLEEYTDHETMVAKVGSRIEATFIPMRNALFFTIAFNRAVALGCQVIMTGISEADSANYPDCTVAFKTLMEKAANQSLGYLNYANDPRKIDIVAPLVNFTKARSIELAASLPGCFEALAYSHTSYDGLYPPTGMNHANVLRAQGFWEAGYGDPLVLRAVAEGLMELPKTSNYDRYRS
ncbi:MAG: 7-cyano-7-deazaguanine synthase [Alphaproteobacteria bacterium]|nr:7-cyano-7-deazaguanine synthase [Alphaproteobacteria bacterium]